MEHFNFHTNHDIQTKIQLKLNESSAAPEHDLSLSFYISLLFIWFHFAFFVCRPTSNHIFLSVRESHVQSSLAKLPIVVAVHIAFIDVYFKIQGTRGFQKGLGVLIHRTTPRFEHCIKYYCK
jgi:hypothetical protein